MLNILIESVSSDRRSRDCLMWVSQGKVFGWLQPRILNSEIFEVSDHPPYKKQVAFNWKFRWFYVRPPHIETISCFQMNIKAIERIFFMENNFFKSHPTFPYKEYKMKFSKIQFSLCFERERNMLTLALTRGS